jgi:hypothetical protein
MALSTKRPSAEKAKQRLLEEVQATAVRTRRLNADIELPLYRRMKAQAVAEDRTLAAITRELWIEYLRQHAPE